MSTPNRRFELDDLLIRPGTYFNPQTEVMVVVDDSPSLDGEIFSMEEFEGADWVLISDETPVDEPQRDELLESFQATFSQPDSRASGETADAFEEDEEEDDPQDAPLDEDIGR
jgi:hypothetical protein